MQLVFAHGYIWTNLPNHSKLHAIVSHSPFLLLINRHIYIITVQLNVTIPPVHQSGVIMAWFWGLWCSFWKEVVTYHFMALHYTCISSYSIIRSIRVSKMASNSTIFLYVDSNCYKELVHITTSYLPNLGELCTSDSMTLDNVYK